MTNLNQSLSKQFRRIGATIQVRPRDTSFRIDIANVRSLPRKQGEKVKKEIFDLQIADDTEVLVVDVRPKDRHLLLHVKEANGTTSKFLCGHDERHFFSAGVPTQANSVLAAKDLLMPAPIRERALNVPVKERHKRHNEIFKRQGEWFFELAPNFSPSKIDTVRFDEPLQRGRSKPHIAKELVNFGGTAVMVGNGHPNGLTLKEFEALPEKTRKRPGWRRMLRDGTVYVRGHIRHPDHKTLILHQWHRVSLSNEVMSERMAFLD